MPLRNGRCLPAGVGQTVTCRPVSVTGHPAPGTFLREEPDREGRVSRRAAAFSEKVCCGEAAPGAKRTQTCGAGRSRVRMSGRVVQEPGAAGRSAHSSTWLETDGGQLAGSSGDREQAPRAQGLGKFRGGIAPGCEVKAGPPRLNTSRSDRLLFALADFTQGWLHPARASAGMMAESIASTRSAEIEPAHRQRNEKVMRIRHPDGRRPL